VLGSVLVAAAVAAVIGAVTELLTGTEAAAVDRVDRVELGDGEVV
jgi:Ca2+/H+ antiporter